MDHSSHDREPLSKFQEYFHWLAARFPEGRVGVDNAISSTIDGNELDIIIFPPTPKNVSFGLFIPEHRYSRKTLLVDSAGTITEDREGTLPDFDTSDDEPVFTSSNEHIFEQVMTVLKEAFPDN